MAALTSVLLGLGTLVSVGGAALQYQSAREGAEEQKKAALAGETARQQQNQLDAARRRRDAIRSSIVARSNALATGTAQGVSLGSGVAGAQGQATNEGFDIQQTTSAAEVLGNRSSRANRDYIAASARQTEGMAAGSFLSSVGGALVASAGTINRLGNYAIGRRPDQGPNYT